MCGSERAVSRNGDSSFPSSQVLFNMYISPRLEAYAFKDNCKYVLPQVLTDKDNGWSFSFFKQNTQLMIAYMKFKARKVFTAYI